MLLYVLTGKKIKIHEMMIPKNAPESKEGEPERSLLWPPASPLDREVGGELVGCLFSGCTYSPGARQEPVEPIHGNQYAVGFPPFRLGWLQYRGQIGHEFVQSATQTHFLC